MFASTSSKTKQQKLFTRQNPISPRMRAFKKGPDRLPGLLLHTKNLLLQIQMCPWQEIAICGWLLSPNLSWKLTRRGLGTVHSQARKKRRRGMAGKTCCRSPRVQRLEPRVHVHVSHSLQIPSPRWRPAWQVARDVVANVGNGGELGRPSSSSCGSVLGHPFAELVE